MFWKMFCKTAIMAGLILIITTGAAMSENEPASELTTGKESLVTANNRLGFNLIREILKEDRDKNIFISPSSIAMALAMAYNGADGTTRDAMHKTLELDGLTLDQVNRANLALIKELMNLDSAVQFTIANSLWYRNTFRVEQTFIDINREFYNSEVAGLDFGDSGAKDIINGWVDENTNGKIKKIITNIDAQAMLFLINAIYFKGTWTSEFNKDRTKDDEFFTGSGTTVPCRMMYQDDRFPYYEDSTAQMIRLPYGSNEFSMTVVLPRPNVSLNTLINKMNADTWQLWSSRLHNSEGKIYLPSFKMEYEIKLNDVLTALGMEIAFDPNKANFTRINPDGQIYISEVKHKTFVDVNEEGTEAAAVTSIGMALACAPEPGFVMRVDRPFLFVIGDRQTGTVLFVGKVVKPVRD